LNPASESKAASWYLLAGLSFLCGVILTVVVIQLIHPRTPPLPIPAPPATEENEADPMLVTEPTDPSPVSAPPIMENPMAFEPVEDDLRAGPIPLEWDGPLFAVLELEDMDRRNFGLIQMATVTAKGVPRVQAECLAHLTFGLEEKDHAQFLMLARNRSLPLESRLQFLKETFEIRRPEFSEWLAKNLTGDPQKEISTAALDFLAELKARPADTTSNSEEAL